MKILQLCKKFPYPIKDGESIAVNYLSRAINELDCEISLLAFNTKKHPCDLTKLPKDFNQYKAYHTVELDNQLKLKDAFLNLFSKDSYHITRFISKEFTEKLIELLQKEDYDVVHLETIVMAPYIPIIREHSTALVSMRAHNVEHEIWGRVADNTSFLPKKWYLRECTDKLKNFEVEQLKNYDLLAAITERDLKIFQRLGHKKASMVTPIGLDIRDYNPDDSSFDKRLSLSFIGSLDWMPNQEGLEWFLNEAWPEALRLFPSLTFHVAGRNMPSKFLKMNDKEVKILGEIPDALSFINEHSVMIVPLKSGSGMRVKILEGMALGKVIITTSIGLEGIHAQHKKEVLIADTAEEFVDCIRFCQQHPNKLKAMGKRAQVFVAGEFDNLEIARRLLQTYRNKIGPKPSIGKRYIPAKDVISK